MSLKEFYFTLKDIDKKSIKMLKKIERYRKRHRMNLAPRSCALLVLDMQKYFLDRNSHAFVPSAIAIIPNIKKLINFFKEKNLPVIFTKHINSKKDAGLMDKWWKELITQKNPLSEIISELNFYSSPVIRKTQYDAFYNTSLENLLKEKNKTQLVITGVMTNLCCETTARSGFVRGFEIYFTIDGTATYNEELHIASLLNLSHGFAIPVLCKEVLRNFKNG